MKDIKPEIEERPINQIKIAGTQILSILSIDLNQGWEITNIEFDDCCPLNYIDKLVVTFEKVKRKYKMHDEIVRCKDCKWNTGEHKCLYPDSIIKIPNDDDFCSYAERRKV